MSLTRRQFAFLSASSALALAWPGSSRALGRMLLQAPAGRVFEWRPIGDRCQAAFGQGGNALLVASGGEAVLIDAKLTGIGASLRREAESFGARLTRLVNTHHHADHTGGNHAFTRDLPVLAHEKCKPRVSAQLERYMSELKSASTRFSSTGDEADRAAAADVKALLDDAATISARTFEPTEVMSAEKTLKVGDVKVELRHAGPGHTDNDVFVFLPAQNVLHTGDLVFHMLHPFVDAQGGANSMGWQRSIDAMIALCDDKTVVVPGHGELTDKTGLTRQREYFDLMRAFVNKCRANGLSRADLVKQKPDGFAGYGFEQVLPRVLGALYDEQAS